MNISFKKFTQKQKQTLIEDISWRLALIRYLFLIIILSFLFWLPTIIIYKFFHYKVHFIWWVLPTVLITGFIYIKFWIGGRERRKKIKLDLARGNVSVMKVEVVDAIEIIEKEDDGESSSSYIILTQDGSVLYFQYEETGFPFKSFEIIEAPQSKIIFGINKIGESFKPEISCYLSEEQKEKLGLSFLFFNVPIYVTLDINFELLKNTLI